MAVTDEAIERIKEMIVSGALRPGDRLPREADLAAQLGLSRNSLREAVRALSLMRVLDVRQGDGTYVTSLEPNLLLDALSFVVEVHHDTTVLEFFEVRRMLEPHAVAMAAMRMTDEQVESLRAHLGEVGADSSADDLVANDLEFHRRIAEASGNSVLCSLLENLAGPTMRGRIWRGLTQEGAWGRTHAEHQAILDAIADRQPDVARGWATVHVAGVEQWLRRSLLDP
ncbi:FadR/GntR family transcriptional regulator [Spirillospora sp. NPDC048911]|uniref:FadR/GntR family transcriptional regulator n=1 Tax=Spirillospora sp. NPDC048911 TaxID=3364527 RepID=UPI00371E8D68